MASNDCYATITKKISESIYYAIRSDQTSQFVLYLFLDQEAAVNFKTLFSRLSSVGFRNNYTLGMVNNQHWCVTTDIPAGSYPLTYWVEIQNPFVNDARGEPFDITEAIKTVLRGVAEGMLELIKNDRCYGISLENTLVSSHGQPIMLASVATMNGSQLEGDINEYSNLVRCIIEDGEQNPTVITNFFKLHQKSNRFVGIRKRLFSICFYQNPLIFTPKERIDFIRYTDKALDENSVKFKLYIRLNETTMNSWTSRIPKEIPLLQDTLIKNTRYESARSFIPYRRNLGEHATVKNLSEIFVEEQYFQYFPESCFVVFNALMDTYGREGIIMEECFSNLLDKSTWLGCPSLLN